MLHHRHLASGRLEEMKCDASVHLYDVLSKWSNLRPVLQVANVFTLV
jgi:hypothetical protein